MHEHNADGRFPIVMIGGPVDGESTTLLRAGANAPGTAMGVPQFSLGPHQVAWYDRLGTEPIGGRWVFLYRETGGAERALRTLVTRSQSEVAVR